MNNFLTTIKIKNLLKIIHNFFKISPYKHWSAFIYFFIGLIIFSILVSIYFLHQINSENIFQIKKEEQNTPVLLEGELLKNTINLQEKKSKKTLEIKNSPSLYTE